MAQMIVDGLRSQPTSSGRPGFHDPGNDGDVEEEYPGPRARKTGAPKRRSALENKLSVCYTYLPLLGELTISKQRIRNYMRRLITPASLLRNTVREEEAKAFDPDYGPCCDALHFRVHLEGTTHDAWNRSAIGVFVNHFLEAHPEYPSEQESVQEMVRMKSFSTLDTLIRNYRESNVRRTEEEVEGRQLAKNRYERKRKVSSGAPCPLLHQW